ncbi:hypothetical protein GQ600_8820 [Phytophthora cactorum]|nr:hypothetical protein GQ600_8820 [Phytophthora cactorum]
MEIAALCGGTIVLTTTTWLCRSWPWQLRTPSACSPTPRAVSPQEVLVVTDLMLTGDYDGARKAALAYAWLDIVRMVMLPRIFCEQTFLVKSLIKWSSRSPSRRCSSS